MKKYTLFFIFMSVSALLQANMSLTIFYNGRNEMIKLQGNNNAPPTIANLVDAVEKKFSISSVSFGNLFWKNSTTNSFLLTPKDGLFAYNFDGFFTSKEVKECGIKDGMVLEMNSIDLLVRIAINSNLSDDLLLNVSYDASQTITDLKNRIKELVKHKLKIGCFRGDGSLGTLDDSAKLSDFGIVKGGSLRLMSFIDISLKKDNQLKTFQVPMGISFKDFINELIKNDSSLGDDFEQFASKFVIKKPDGTYWDIGFYSDKRLVDLGMYSGVTVHLEPKNVFVLFDSASENEVHRGKGFNISLALIGDTVASLKTKIREVSGINLDTFLCVHREIVLEDQKRLSYYPNAIKNGDTITMYKKKDVGFVEVIKGSKAIKITGGFDDRMSKASLMGKIKQVFSIENDEGYRYVFKKSDGQIFQDLSNQTHIPLKKNIKVTLVKGEVVKIKSNDLISFVDYSPELSLNELIRKKKIFFHDTDRVWIGAKMVSESDYTKTLKELGIRKNDLIRIETLGYKPSPIEHIKAHTGKIIFSLSAVALAYSVYRFAKTDIFGRWWYDRLGRYEKVTEQKQVAVMAELSNLYVWRSTQLHQAKNGEERDKIALEFEVKKERILRPFSPEDREKLEKAFEQKEEKKQDGNQTKYFVKELK